MCVKTRAFEHQSHAGWHQLLAICTVLQHCRTKILIGSKVNGFPASSRHAAESLLRSEEKKKKKVIYRMEDQKRCFSRVQNETKTIRTVPRSRRSEAMIGPAPPRCSRMER